MSSYSPYVMERIASHPKFEEACRLGIEFSRLCYEMNLRHPSDLLVGLPVITPIAIAHFQEGYKQGVRDEQEKVQRALKKLLDEP